MRHGLGHLDLLAAALAAALATALLAGCGGGGGSTGSGATSIVPVAPPKATSALTITGTINGSGPYVLSGKRRPTGTRHPSSPPTFDHIDVQGTLYAADASAVTISNTATIPPPAGTVYTAAVGFSNVTAGNNEWALLTFTGVAADGSKIALGEVGGLVNVGSSGSTASLNAATTQQLQLFITLLAGGLVSTYDIDNNPNLPNVLANVITIAGVTPDPASGVFTAGAMQQLYNASGPTFMRTVSLSTSPSTQGNFTIVRDYTDPSELNLEASLTAFLASIGIPSVQTSNAGSFLLVTSGVLGYDRACGGFSVKLGSLHLAGPGLPVVPSDVYACSVPNAGGASQVRNVYGGHLMIGATNDPYDPSAPFALPFVGGWTSVAGRPGGSPAATVTVPVASTEDSIAVIDPYEAAFPLMTAPYAAFPTFGSGPLSATNFHPLKYSPDPYRVVESGFVGNNETVTVDTFNPWNVQPANLSLCSIPIPLAVAIVLPSCYPLGTAQPIAINRLFGDDGSNLAYYNWAVGGAGGSIAADLSGATYDVTPNAGIITLATTTPTALYGRTQFTVYNSLPLGTTWTVTVTTAVNHATHQSLGTNVTCGCGATVAHIELDDLASIKAIENITFTVDAGGAPFTFGPIYADPSETSIGGNSLKRRFGAALRRR